MTKDKRPIYLDYQATTPVDERVVDAMVPFFTEAFGNPHSTSHAFGAEAHEAVEQARQKIAEMINADPREVVFTSGATESNNMAIKGVGRFAIHKKEMAHPHMIVPKSEHKCVLESAKAMIAEGVNVTWLPVQSDGLIDLSELRAALRPETVLVSVMMANNETGVIQPITEIAAICHEFGAYLHTDAAQAAGKMLIDVRTMDIDLMSLSAHKMYGPMGVGALYVRRRPRVRLDALMDGGGQERTMRSGTVPAPLVVGFGVAAQLVSDELVTEGGRILELRERLRKGLQQQAGETFINGSRDHRLAGNLNIGFRGIDAQALLGELHDKVAVSSGSACTSNSVEPSYVLRAMGVSDEDANSSIRICVGRMTTADEVDQAIDTISTTVNKIRAGGGDVHAAPAA